MSRTSGGIRGALLRYAGRLRFPYLLALTTLLFLLDVIFPDFLPYADEIFLALAALILARLKRPEGEKENSPLRAR